jgi:hypothetical protein
MNSTRMPQYRMCAQFTHVNAQGIWSPQEQSLQINFLELNAVHLALKVFAKTLVNKPVHIGTDNTIVVAYINKQGGTRSWELCVLLWRILT